jgi:hypothetical protein
MIVTPDETVAPLASALVRAGRAGSGRRIALPNGTASGSVTPLMDRGAFISTFAGGLLAAPPAAEAQEATKVPRIGYLTVDLAANPHLREAFVQGLRESRAGPYSRGRTGCTPGGCHPASPLSFPS